MAKAGDYYVISLKKSHIEWGTHRYTGSRGDVLGEGYLPIPLSIAKEYGIVNSNGTSYGQDELGKNIFRCTSADGVFRGNLKAQGSNTAGSIYAKQFAGDGDLKALGSWYAHIGAIEGTRIKVEWVSPEHIILSVVDGTSKTSSIPFTGEKKISNDNTTTTIKNEKSGNIAKVNQIVSHIKWGDGVIIKVETDRIYVKFDIGRKMFLIPDCFDKGFLRFCK